MTAASTEFYNNMDRIKALVNAEDKTDRERDLASVLLRAIDLIGEISADGGAVEAATNAILKVQAERDAALRELEESQQARERLSQHIIGMGDMFSNDLKAALREGKREAWYAGHEAGVKNAKVEDSDQWEGCPYDDTFTAGDGD